MSIQVGTNAFIATLAQSLAAGGSEATIYLSTITNLVGEAISTSDFATFGKGSMTIDPLSSANIEFVSFTGVDSTNIAVTGATRNLSGKGYTALTSTSKYHAAGTQVIIGFGTHNLSDIINYIQSLVAGTIGNASSTLAGVTKLTQDPASPTAPIAVGSNTSLSGTAISTTNKAVDQAFVSTYTSGYAADAGVSDSYAITMSPVPAAYTSGMAIKFLANTANTGAASLNANTLGAKTIKKNVSSDLATGDILAGQIVHVIYDGTNFQMISPISSSLTAVASGSATHDLSSTTTQTIAHGLGVVPKLVHVQGASSNAAQGSWSLAWATISGGVTTVIDINADGGTGTNSSFGTTFTLQGTNGSVSGGVTATGTITVDATNISIAWGKGGSPTGTAQLTWDAIA